MKKLRCFLDGNRLCVVADDFVDLQVGDAVFIELFTHNIGEIQKYKRGKYRIIMIKYNEYLNYFKESMDYLLNDEDLEILNELRTKIVKKENNDDVALKLREQNMELVKRLIEVENEKLDLVCFMSKLIIELTELKQERKKEDGEPDDIEEYIDFHINQMRARGEEPKHLIAHKNYVYGIDYLCRLKLNPFKTDFRNFKVDSFKGLKIIETDKDILMVV